MSIDPETSKGRGIVAAGLLPLAIAGIAWFAVVRIIGNDWKIDPQYSYGFLVPLLVLGLLMKRWEDRPDRSIPSRVVVWTSTIVMLSSAFLIAAVVPMAEANPDWRPLGSIAALAAVGLTLSMIVMAGGLPWLRHFAFPVCFFLIAVPWPRNLEQSVMSALMSWNTSTTMEILHWCGYEAIRQGNLIVIPSGVLGIEEACSGIRSLQSGLMVALFFGEIFRLNVPRRILLLLVAFLAALAGNVLRSSLLAIEASRQGISAVASWHDPAGLIVLLLTIASVIGCAMIWRNQHPGKHQRRIGKGSTLPSSPRAFPGMVLVAVSLLLVVPILLTEAWFRQHDLPAGTSWAWEIVKRKGMPGVSEVPIAPQTLRMLFNPEGFSERWMASSGEVGQAFFFEWPAGRTALQSVQMHSPDVCLANMGMKLEHPLADAETASAGGGIRLHGWLFSQEGRPVYVFHSILEQGAQNASSGASDQSPMGRLHNLLLGKRGRGQRMIEVAFWNLSDEASAREALARYFKDSLTCAPSPFSMNH